jgi:CHAD domain-containing protein
MSALILETPARVAIATSLEVQLEAWRNELAVSSRKPRRGSVHRLRVATRRLLAALELSAAAGCVVPKALPRRLDDLLKVLAPLRDAQVMRRGLKQLERDKVTRALARDLRRHDRKLRARAARKLRRFEADELVDKISKVGANVRGAAGQAAAPLGELSLTGHLAAQQLALELGRARALDSSPHELHQLRLQLKRYRYSLEILENQLVPSAARLLELTTELQDELGRAHDCQVLCELVSERARSSEKRRRLAESLTEESRLAHAQAAERLHDAQLQWPLGVDTTPKPTRTKSAP